MAGANHHHHEPEHHVLVQKQISPSDLSTSVLRSGRVILPRILMDKSYPKFVELSSEHTISEDARKSKSVLYVHDQHGNQWCLHLKRWFSSADKPIYVLEGTLQALKVNKASPGAILQLDVKHGNQLHMAILKPDSVQARAVQVVTAPCNRSPGCKKPEGHPGFCSGQQTFRAGAKASAAGAVGSGGGGHVSSSDVVHKINRGNVRKPPRSSPRPTPAATRTPSYTSMAMYDYDYDDEASLGYQYEQPQYQNQPQEYQYQYNEDGQLTAYPTTNTAGAGGGEGQQQPPSSGLVREAKELTIAATALLSLGGPNSSFTAPAVPVNGAADAMNGAIAAAAAAALQAQQQQQGGTIAQHGSGNSNVTSPRPYTTQPTVVCSGTYAQAQPPPTTTTAGNGAFPMPYHPLPASAPNAPPPPPPPHATVTGGVCFPRSSTTTTFAAGGGGGGGVAQPTTPQGVGIIRPTPRKARHCEVSLWANILISKLQVEQQEKDAKQQQQQAAAVQQQHVGAAPVVAVAAPHNYLPQFTMPQQQHQQQHRIPETSPAEKIPSIPHFKF